MNPITRLDYPDPDAIRVGDTYYMVSTTMHFMPGCEILRSYDLRNWEHLSYVYEKLDSTPGQTLEGEENIYGKGMWAASLRYHDGTYYVCFVANDTHKTYLYTASRPEGPWEKRYIEGFFHDCSLLFDDDGKVYIVYGNREIWLTQLKEDLSAPLEGGLHRLIVSDKDNPHLGYEGSHLYKIRGKYYLFLIHSRPDMWRRTESCFVADSLEGEFLGGDVLDDDCGLPNRGVAQGPIVDTPEGKWYAIQFQDSGAVGRVPFLMPVTWEDDYPVFGDRGTIPQDFPVESTRPGYVYAPLVGSDDFKGDLKTHWEFNHEPDLSLIAHDREAGTWQVATDKVCASLLQARNTLTQRMLMPGCAAEVTVDGGGLREGDFAGLCALQSCFGFLGLTRRNGELQMVVRTVEPGEFRKFPPENRPEEEWAAVPVEEKPYVLKLEADFSEGKDVCSFYYKDRSFWSRWQKIGPEHQLRFSMEHFCGCRFGLTVYSTREAGGSAAFSEFVYRER
ncbi:MAG: glycosyl hydrolase 43 family protein [Lachnospiraceae bacterium]|nr:glycosyl hydrolase 43 family protein [Lachnospiraceae bacterium]